MFKQSQESIVKSAHTRLAIAFIMLLSGISLVAQGSASKVAVFKDPTCGCCSKWVDHFKESGFATTTQVTDMDPIKAKYRVPSSARSCHTAVVDGYFIEGHVPAADVRRLLKERPKGVIGLAVPGMPIGSPGMEVNGVKPQSFNVIAFDADGKSRIFASH